MTEYVTVPREATEEMRVAGSAILESRVMVFASDITTTWEDAADLYRAMLSAAPPAGVVREARFGPYGYLVIPSGLQEDHWRLEDNPEPDPECMSIALYADTDPFAGRAGQNTGTAKGDFTSRAYKIICEAAGSNQGDWSSYDHSLLDLAREADATFTVQAAEIERLKCLLSMHCNRTKMAEEENATLRRQIEEKDEALDISREDERAFSAAYYAIDSDDPLDCLRAGLKAIRAARALKGDA